jgi:hypothetical protein
MAMEEVGRSNNIVANTLDITDGYADLSEILIMLQMSIIIASVDLLIVTRDDV